MATAPQSHSISVGAYFERDRASDRKYEYYDGWVRLMAGGTPQHAMLSMNMGAALTVALRGSSWRVFSSDARAAFVNSLCLTRCHRQLLI